MSSSQFKLLGSRKFLPLFITQFLGAFNDNIFKSALVVLVTFKLVTSVDHAQLLINMAGGIFILPFFLFSATVGQLADKFDRTKIIRIIKLSSLIPRSLLRDFTRWGIPKGEKCEFSPFGCECKLGLHSRNHIGKYPVACYGVFDCGCKCGRGGLGMAKSLYRFFDFSVGQTVDVECGTA